MIFHWLDIDTSRDVIIFGFIFKNVAEKEKNNKFSYCLNSTSHGLGSSLPGLSH